MTGSGSLREQPGRLVLVGAPMEAGANGGGSRLGPSSLRRAGLARTLDQLSCDVVDHGHVAPVVANGARKLSEAARWISYLSDAAYEIARDGHLPAAPIERVLGTVAERKGALHVQPGRRFPGSGLCPRRQRAGTGRRNLR